MTKKKIYDEGLNRLTDMLAEEIISTSEEDILKEVREEGENPDLIAETTKKLFESVYLNISKARLATAKAAVKADKCSNNITQLDPISARKKLEKFLATNPNAKDMTLAARKGQNLSDQDIKGMLEDLENLGIDLSDDS